MRAWRAGFDFPPGAKLEDFPLYQLVALIAVVGALGYGVYELRRAKLAEDELALAKMTNQQKEAELKLIQAKLSSTTDATQRDKLQYQLDALTCAATRGAARL